jgi:hypothetical protein
MLMNSDDRETAGMTTTVTVRPSLSPEGAIGLAQSGVTNAFAGALQPIGLKLTLLSTEYSG